MRKKNFKGRKENCKGVRGEIHMHYNIKGAQKEAEEKHLYLLKTREAALS